MTKAEAEVEVVEVNARANDVTFNIQRSASVLPWLQCCSAAGLAQVIVSGEVLL